MMNIRERKVDIVVLIMVTFMMASAIGALADSEVVDCQEESSSLANACTTQKDCDQTEYDTFDKVSFTYQYLYPDEEDGYCWYEVTEYEYSCVKECERCRWCTTCWLLPPVCGRYGPETCSESCTLNGTETTIQRLSCSYGWREP